MNTKISSVEVIEAVKSFHESEGDYNLQIGFVEEKSDGVWAVEVTYNWKLNAWEKTVHRIEYCFKNSSGIHVVSAGYTLDFKEHKVKKNTKNTK